MFWSPRSQMDFTTSSPDVFKNIRPVVWLASLPAVWQPCWLWYHEGDMLGSALTYLYIPAARLRYQSQSRTRLVHFPTAASFLAKSQTQIQTLACDRGDRRRLSSLPTSSPFFFPSISVWQFVLLLCCLGQTKRLQSQIYNQSPGCL